ncbi:MAG TPA: FAD-dependent oxidoreductase, partial [Longimicrobiales bacterium]|nr:FAD-dependent oxidoreductase [Longimicrobiales bacterium]
MIPAAVDVLIVGAGPAGIATAVHAAGAGHRVLVVDEGARPGGQIWRHPEAGAAPREAVGWLARLAAAGIEVLSGTTVFDAPVPGALRVLRGTDAATIRYQQLVIATGARELLLPFPGWTLPGVIGVGGAQALLKAGLDVRGR